MTKTAKNLEIERRILLKREPEIPGDDWIMDDISQYYGKTGRIRSVNDTRFYCKGR